MLTSQKLKKHRKTFALLLVFTYLILLGVFTYNNHRTSSLFQKGMKIRNSYSDFRIEKIDGATSYSRFPHRLFEIQADENTLYSYRDDFYKDYSESDTTIDRNKIVIYLTQRQVFDNPIAVGKQPECEAMAKIESQKRQPEYYENGPFEFDMKWQDERRPPLKKVYVYTPKNGHCKNVFSDSQKLKVQGSANSIRLSF
jgi:hypothetical protein